VRTQTTPVYRIYTPAGMIQDANVLKVRFSATLGQEEPDVELALA